MGRRKTKTIGIRIEPDRWESFCALCAGYGRTPGDVLRELIDHAHEAWFAIHSGRLRMLDGDLAAFIRGRFADLPLWQWELFADIAREIAEQARRAAEGGG